MPTFRTGSAAPLLLILIATLVSAQKTGPSESEYITQALSAAPEAVAKDAMVVRMDKDGKITTLREGKNGFSCMVIGRGEKMCADANSMEFFDAWAKHQPPPNKLGLTYMLSGYDVGGSNTDPYAMSKTADNHWVVTGPHVMILGPASKSLGLPSTAEVDPAKPYMMWVGTPYEHAMIPVGSDKSQRKPVPAKPATAK
jgi:hypothetical protein